MKRAVALATIVAMLYNPTAALAERYRPKNIPRVVYSTDPDSVFQKSVDHIIEDCSKKHSVRPELVRAVYWAESARNWGCISKAGARGGFQLMPDTAKAHGLAVFDYETYQRAKNAEDKRTKQYFLGLHIKNTREMIANYGLSLARFYDGSLNPSKATDVAVRILRRNLDLYNGDEVLAVAAYNAGVTAVEKHEGVPPYKETKSFIATVDKYMGQQGVKIKTSDKGYIEAKRKRERKKRRRERKKQAEKVFWKVLFHVLRK